MKFKTWKEARFDILAYTLIPLIVGGLSGIPPRGWVDIRHFFSDNSTFFVCIVAWLLMSGILLLFAEAPTPKLLKVKRTVGVIVITLWVWGAFYSGLTNPVQVPIIQHHVSPPDLWWRGGKN